MASGVHRKKTKRLTRRSSGFVEKITRSFGLKWINRDVDNSPPLLSKDKVERVARSRDEPFLAQEMADLPESSGEGPLEARWATLTPKSQVWADRAKTQLFCQELLCPPLVKEAYTTPSEALLNNASKTWS
ncbi:hypothetical protein GW17_00030271 [Ensete ventricosum]|nr:hypothetical protein GW17_00030271 [Ensete ventricosum]